MSDWPNLKIDIWWKAVLTLGVLATIGAAAFEIEFLERKHLFGMGLGVTLIGIGLWKAYKIQYKGIRGAVNKYEVYKHDIISVLLIISGVLLMGYFGHLIVKGLI